MDDPAHQPAQGEQDMATDDRPGQPATDGTLADIVLDQPDGQQVEPDERGNEPADQGGNAHGLSSRRSQGPRSTSPVVRRAGWPIRPIPWVLAHPSPYVTDASKLRYRPAPGVRPAGLAGGWSRRSASSHARRPDRDGSNRRRSWVRRSSSRIPPRSPGTAPSARPCTSTLPRAAASTGPATTGRPHASAVSWHSRWFRAPPPTIWTVSTCRPVSSWTSARARR